jgi:hypothetical protein
MMHYSSNYHIRSFKNHSIIHMKINYTFADTKMQSDKYCYIRLITEVRYAYISHETHGHLKSMPLHHQTPNIRRLYLSS